MIQIHGLTLWLRNLVRRTHQGHVDTLFGTSVAALGGEDYLGEQSRARSGLAIVSVNVAIRETRGTSGHFHGIGVILAALKWVLAELVFVMLHETDLAYTHCRGRLIRNICIL